MSDIYTEYMMLILSVFDVKHVLYLPFIMTCHGAIREQ